MVIHVLPGDAQLGAFKQTGIEGEVVVCRECLVEGPVDKDNLEDLWRARAEFLSVGDQGSYFSDVVPEFNKLISAAAGSEVNLWFEYELFCQANMWFCLYLLKDAGAEIYRVEPALRTEIDKWDGFGGMGPSELEKCFVNRTKFAPGDVALGSELWDAFRRDDRDKLRELGETSSSCFPYLSEVCAAAAEKDSRPQKVLEDIVGSGEQDFGKIFTRFRAAAGVYGYGDDQVRRLLENYRS